jgi:hypothetical protein
MESNGERGRIHVSQATADSLTASGKGHWLILREDKIVAKGKGEMTTYWVNVSTVSPGSMLGSTMDTSSYAPGQDQPAASSEEASAVDLNPDQLMAYLGRAGSEKVAHEA